MPEHASRFAAALYDQFEDEHPVADWGGDELFTRMPRPRAVDDAPAPRFRPYLAASDPGAGSGSSARASTSAARASAAAARASRSSSAGRPSAAAARASGSSARAARRSGAASRPLALVEPLEELPRADEPSARERRRAAGSAEQAMIERAERLGLSVVEPARRWDESPPPAGRQTKVITGHPGGAPRPLATVRADRRRRPPRTPADWIGARPERIVGWAFALGLLLILIAISTADAATL
jgi:hypothetical protein